MLTAIYTHTHTLYAHTYYAMLYMQLLKVNHSTPPFLLCPNVRAIFNCTVCESNSDSTYWMVGNYSPCVLLHSFPDRDDRCGLNNTFVAKLRPAEGDCYSSTFDITAFPSLSGSMVRCYVQVPGIARERTVGERRLEVIGECCMKDVLMCVVRPQQLTPSFLHNSATFLSMTAILV